MAVVQQGVLVVPASAVASVVAAAHAEPPAVTSPDRAHVEPAAAAEVAAVVVEPRHVAAVVALAVAPVLLHVHRAAAVALAVVELDVRLVQHGPDAPRVAVAVVPPRELDAVPPVASFPLVAVVQRHEVVQPVEVVP